MTDDKWQLALSSPSQHHQALSAPLQSQSGPTCDLTIEVMKWGGFMEARMTYRLRAVRDAVVSHRPRPCACPSAPPPPAAPLQPRPTHGMGDGQYAWP